MIACVRCKSKKKKKKEREKKKREISIYTKAIQKLFTVFACSVDPGRCSKSGAV